MILGLIGGVGSGKSAVTDILSGEYGYRLLLTDDMAKGLEEPGQPGYERLTEAFGEQILEAGAGSPICKAALAALIYADSGAMERVNSLIHPLVWDAVEKEVRQERLKAKAEGREPRLAVETALPCERYAALCDEIWFIYADPAVRIGRLMEARGYSLEKCKSRIESQLSDEEFLAYADYSIDNSGSLEESAGRVRELLAPQKEGSLKEAGGT